MELTPAVPDIGPVAARRVLFLAAVAFVPVAYWAVEIERAPVLRLLLVAGMTGAAAIGEPGGVVSILAVALATQSLLWLGLFAALARLAVRRLPPPRRGLAVAGAVIALGTLALFPIYRTPFARAGARTNIFGVLR